MASRRFTLMVDAQLIWRSVPVSAERLEVHNSSTAERRSSGRLGSLFDNEAVSKDRCL
jgi:hypothetical protein